MSADMGMHAASATVVRRSVAVRGVVQGVGFRPFVVRLAGALGLAGSVGNDATSVFVEVEGPATAVAEFLRRIDSDAPPLATVLSVTSKSLAPTGATGFTIVPSRPLPGERTLVPPDVATCEDCLAELHDPSDRRYRHAFITCTNCGPRFTIIEDLPYDRPATTMRAFALCDACATEYADPADRRYHAQPVSCHDCGPRLWFERGEDVVTGTEPALAAAIDCLRRGGTVAIKGIGGFHLACDATDEDAVVRLRQRKHRPDKPFAVMARDLLTASGLVDLDETGADLLSLPARPIVLLPARPGHSLAESVAPGLDELGVLLPYAPVQHLLLEALPLLVMTSGNLADEPLCFTDDDARARLGDIADGFLLHDRRIAVPCEDSVFTVVDRAELPIRRSRGYAPLPVLLDGPGAAEGPEPQVLAVGAEIKNTFTLTRGDLAFCSAHLGDMGSLETRAAFERSVDQLTTLHAVRPELLVVDEHPGYLTGSWGEAAAAAAGLPLERVQHHHAHLASLLAEHGATTERCLGVTFDGTGYGCDRSVWGGEVLYVDGDLRQARRVGHLEPFGLPGGERAVREPWRIAMALLHATGSPDPWGLRLAADVPQAHQEVVAAQLATGTGVVATTSAGRLFDGVAALLGVRLQAGYEAQPAIELEHLARRAVRSVRLRLDVEDGVMAVGPLVRDLVSALRDGADVEALALGFHEALGDATARLVVGRAAELGVGTVGLTGGVMQNRVLVSRLAGVLRGAGLQVLTHRIVPPNDGGLSLGQAVVGRARFVAGGPDRLSGPSFSEPSFSELNFSGREGDD